MTMIENTKPVTQTGKTIRYYGGKSKLTNFIIDSLEKSGMKSGMTILDGFTGTSVVAQRFKMSDFQTTANDHLVFSYSLADAHLHFNSLPKFSQLHGIENVFDYLNSLKDEIDFITKNYSPYMNNERMYVSIDNAMKIDAVRNQIHDWEMQNLINKHEKNYLIASLIHAVNLVSNITGTYGAYLKFWENRSTKKIQLNPLPVINSQFRHRSWNKDINDAINNPFDFMYFDPPYNSRNYFANYFLLELIARGWKEYEFIPAGVTGKPKNFELKSEFNSKKYVEGAIHKLLSSSASNNIAISYNNEGLLQFDKFIDICNIYGKVKTYDFEHKRYRSINQNGENTLTTEKLIYVRKK